MGYQTIDVHIYIYLFYSQTVIISELVVILFGISRGRKSNIYLVVYAGRLTGQ